MPENKNEDNLEPGYVLNCDTCRKSMTYMPWHYSKGTRRHLHACNRCWSDVKPHLKLSANDCEELARKFHESYERLAPHFNYATREETRVFDADSVNGQLMIAVIMEIFGSLEN